MQLTWQTWQMFEVELQCLNVVAMFFLTFLETICSDLLREEVSLQLCHIFGDESKLKLGTARYRVMVLFLGTVFFG